MKKYLILSVLLLGLVGSVQIDQVKKINDLVFKLNYIENTCSNLQK